MLITVCDRVRCAVCGVRLCGIRMHAVPGSVWQSGERTAVSGRPAVCAAVCGCLVVRQRATARPCAYLLDSHHPFLGQQVATRVLKHNIFIYNNLLYNILYTVERFCYPMPKKANVGCKRRTCFKLKWPINELKSRILAWAALRSTPIMGCSAHPTES
jgi:hypothetical protein